MGDGETAGAARRHRRHGRRSHRHRVGRQLRRRDPRGHRRLEAPRHRGRLHAGALVPLQRGRRALPRGSRAAVRRRAEPRRAAALPPHPRDRRGEIEAAVAPALQRAADLLLVHRRGRARGARAPPARHRAGRHRRAQRLAAETNMTFIAKPKVAHPSLPKNSLGLTRRDYEGALSTLCAGCGHDSITAAIVEAGWALALEPPNVAKRSGSGWSSKTTAYFVSGGHGFNSVHGRIPSIAMGANASNPTLTNIVSPGAADPLTIRHGHYFHPNV